MMITATLNYRETEPQKADIVKVDILINGKVLDALSFVCHRSKVRFLTMSSLSVQGLEWC